MLSVKVFAEGQYFHQAVVCQHARRKLNGLVLRIMNKSLSYKALPKPKKCQPILSMQDLPSLPSQCVKYSIKAAHIDVNVNVVAFRVLQYGTSQGYVLCILGFLLTNR